MLDAARSDFVRNVDDNLHPTVRTTNDGPTGSSNTITARTDPRRSIANVLDRDRQQRFNGGGKDGIKIEPKETDAHARASGDLN